jgi:uncharacterized membrane protein YhaH (DUF805 family)
MFRNPFSFDGRIRRAEYGISYLIYMVVIIITSLIIELGNLAVIIGLITYIPLVWFLLAQGAKRCHDRGNSGWYQIIPFYAFWMVFAESDNGINEYGPNPKGVGNIEESEVV